MAETPSERFLRALGAAWRGPLGPAAWGPALAVAAANIRSHWPWKRPRHLVLAVLALSALWLASALPAWRIAWQHRSEAMAGKRPLLKAKSWHYHLDRIDIEALARSDADLLVIDYATTNGRVPIPRADVLRLKRKPDGTPRLVISYMSIGEAEHYRFYWKSEWNEAVNFAPSWLDEPNCAWPGAFAVRFWDADWRRIVFEGSESYLQRIINAGFDGVYLDRVDIYDQYIARRPAAREEMIRFVTDLAATARDRKPGFLVIAQNAEDLLSERRYRDVIDGLGKEDLLYGVDATDKRNKQADIAWSYGQIRKLRDDWKPVFAVEYLTTREGIDKTRKELAALGLVATFQHRSLDGGDPLAPRTDPALKVGSAEWIKEMCREQGKRSW